MLELIGIEKRYGTRTVLSIDRFAFAPGVRTCIIGGNGAGKSTLLRILAGTLSPEKGGQIVRPEGLRVAYMPQKPYPFAKSVLQNVLLGVREGDRQQRRQKAKQAIEAVGLQAFTAQRGDRLSGGEMQRMAFARTIADRHDVLILDEPTASADIGASARVEQALLAYAERHGCGVIMSTHSLVQAMRVAQQVVFMDKGRIVEMGPPEQVILHPTNALTRAFVSHVALQIHDPIPPAQP